MTEKLILVDNTGQMTGTMEKLAAHQAGALHRAFSVFIFNTKGELLLQQRAFKKYHSGGLWTNTCCGHPRPGEQTRTAAKRRLTEEMGLECELEELFQFTYRHNFDNGLTEHEFDHVWIGFSGELPLLNPAEAAAFKYVDLELLALEIRRRPEDYTPWLGICFEQVLTMINQNY